MTSLPNWLVVLLCGFAPIGFGTAMVLLTGALTLEFDKRCSLCGRWKGEHVGGRGGRCPRGKP